MNETNLKELKTEEKSNLIAIISQQDLRSLRNIPIHLFNINFLIEDDNIQFDKKISPLLAACFIGKTEAIQILMHNEEIDINFESQPEGYTPLIVSCFKGYYEIVRILLERNADVRKKNKLGQMPILFCFSRLEEDFYRYENKKICMMMIDLLLSKGADINIRIDKKSGYTILMKLAANEILEKEKADNTLEIIQFLIERGANIYLKGNDNKCVFDLVQGSKYCEQLMKILNNTNQTVFFNTANNDSEPSESGKLNNSGSKSNFFSGIGLNNKKYYMDGEKDILLEANTYKLNCCGIF